MTLAGWEIPLQPGICHATQQTMENYPYLKIGDACPCCSYKVGVHKNSAVQTIEGTLNYDFERRYFASYTPNQIIGNLSEIATKAEHLLLRSGANLVKEGRQC